MTDSCKFVAMALSMFNVLDALSRFSEHPFKCRLALNKWLSPDVVTREKKIEGQGNGFVIGYTTMQSVEIGNAIGPTSEQPRRR